MKPPRISACVITFNEENNIGACLQSIDWVDEIIIVDSFSSDSTTRIAGDYGAKVIQNEFDGYIPQKNLAASRTSGDWILNLDADERVSHVLRKEILAQMASGLDQYAACKMPRLTFYLGRWIHHSGWYPDAKIRLWKRDCGVWAGSDPHEHLEIKGPVKQLKGPLLHYSYTSVSEHLKKINHYTTAMAHSRFQKGCRFNWTDCLVRPPLRFMRHYFLKTGFLDGTAGFFIAVMASYYVFLRYLKLWEIEKNIERTAPHHEALSTTQVPPISRQKSDVAA